jgi:hypothetical protein
LTKDKEIFVLSVATGWLGAIAFLLGRAIDEAQKEQRRALEDARTRFEHAQQNNNDGGDA